MPWFSSQLRELLYTTLFTEACQALHSCVAFLDGSGDTGGRRRSSKIDYVAVAASYLSLLRRGLSDYACTGERPRARAVTRAIPVPPLRVGRHRSLTRIFPRPPPCTPHSAAVVRHATTGTTMDLQLPRSSHSAVDPGRRSALLALSALHAAVVVTCGDVWTTQPRLVVLAAGARALLSASETQLTATQ